MKIQQMMQYAQSIPNIALTLTAAARIPGTCKSIFNRITGAPGGSPTPDDYEFPVYNYMKRAFQQQNKPDQNIPYIPCIDISLSFTALAFALGVVVGTVGTIYVYQNASVIQYFLSSEKQPAPDKKEETTT